MGVFQGIKKLFKTKKSKELDASLCVMPWRNLELRSYGDYAPCCMNRSIPGDDPPRIFEVTPKEAFRGSYMETIRQEMLKGKRPDSCQNCWVIEALGGESMRTRNNKNEEQLLKTIRSKKAKIDQPKAIDIKFGNKCNLKCRICSPLSSNFWLEEYEDIYGKNSLPRLRPNQYSKEQDLERTVGWPSDAEHVWSDLKTWLPDIESIELYGGEPFLNKDMYLLLEESIAKGAAHKQRLQFNTNGTIYSKKLFEEILPNFGHVSISLSLDGTYEQFEYQRFPAKWAIVMNNYKKIKLSPVEITICISLSTLNFYYLPEYLEFWRQENANIHLNEVMMPEYFDISVYPAHIKKEIERKFKAREKTFKGTACEGAVHTFLRQMNAKDQSHLWPEFLKTVRQHDDYRKQNYAEAFPEFANLIGWDKAPSNLHTNKEIQL